MVLIDTYNVAVSVDIRVVCHLININEEKITVSIYFR